MNFYIGIDIGGTFTDGVVLDSEGKVTIHKTPTIPKDPKVGLMNCLQLAAEERGLTLGRLLKNVDKFAFGTTIATNILIEGKGARTGLIMTRGFRDTLPLARVGREYLSPDLYFEAAPSPIPRDLILEVSERVDYAGRPIVPLNAGDVETAIEQFRKEGVEAIAVSFLWSFKNPAHEDAVGEAIRAKLGNVYVSLSHEVAPLMGEYERTATAAMNSILGPPVVKRLSEIAQMLIGQGLKADSFHIMQSSGGLCESGAVLDRPVNLLMSGPSGGAVAGKYLGELIGSKRLLCIDMGGTSFDVSLVHDGVYEYTATSRVNGHSIYVPSVDVHSIGAGGGSIAWVDAGQRLKVGPTSAGADPGPACYGKGGDQPTVTDADVILGYLNPDFFVGGRIKLDRKLAEEAVRKCVAEPLGMSMVEAAYGIRKIVDSNMAGAMRVVTIEKGHDPKDYTIVAYGGAGPTHASWIARESGVKTIVVCPLATAQSAFGVLISDIMNSSSVTNVLDVTKVEEIAEQCRRLEELGYETIGAKRESALTRTVKSADMRYKGQAHLITVALPQDMETGRDVEELVKRFEAKYESLYGRGSMFPQAGIEMVNFRVDVVRSIETPSLPECRKGGSNPQGALKGQRKVFMEQAYEPVNIFDATRLTNGNVINGPAIVEYPGTTAVILSGQRAGVDKWLNLVIKEIR